MEDVGIFYYGHFGVFLVLFGIFGMYVVSRKIWQPRPERSVTLRPWPPSASAFSGLTATRATSGSRLRPKARGQCYGLSFRRFRPIFCGKRQF
jgi:hypothetical protein